MKLFFELIVLLEKFRSFWKYQGSLLYSRGADVSLWVEGQYLARRLGKSFNEVLHGQW